VGNDPELIKAATTIMEQLKGKFKQRRKNDRQPSGEILPASAMAFKIGGDPDGSTPVFWCLWFGKLGKSGKWGVLS
jgi:hypothetical protein